MIKMVFKKIWEQRRGNSWLMIESFIVFILFCFFVDHIWMILSPTLDCPKGYNIDNVYSLKLAKDNKIKTAESTHESIRRIIQQIKEDPAIEAVTAYSGTEHLSTISYLYLDKDSISETSPFFSTDEYYFDVFKIEIKEDGGIFPWKTENGDHKIIFTKPVSELFFENKNPIGKNIEVHTGRIDIPKISYRISGLVKETEHTIRGMGKKNFYCYITTPDEYYKYQVNHTSIAFRIKDGISYKEFENRRMDDFKKLLVAGAIYPESLLSFKQLKKDTISNNGQMTFGLIFIAGLLFFISNMFISMFATFHFRINKRKEEIGLKLSIGASKRTLMKELILEGVLILTFAVIPAIIIIANVYYLEIQGMLALPITFLRFFGCISLTYIILAVTVSLGTWLPARRVMKIEPAIALKEE